MPTAPKYYNIFIPLFQSADICYNVSMSQAFMFQKVISQINDAQKIVVIQAENPDGDSLGTSLALEDVILYCTIDIPKYLRYAQGWDRVTYEWPTDRDMAIIVDTSSTSLLLKTLEIRGVMSFLESHPVTVIDHHTGMDSDLQFDHTFVNEPAVASSQVVYDIAQEAGWTINADAAESMLLAMLSDSLGMTTQNVDAASYSVAAALVALGAKPSEIESRRREYMKKPAEILEYKGRLIQRIEYSLDGALATVHIPWEEIEQYSDKYNPGVLVIDEMRLVEGVEIAVAVKTYPDGKLTGKIRSNIPIAQAVAGYFGGGGHGYSAGFKVYDMDYDQAIRELIEATHKALQDYKASN